MAQAARALTAPLSYPVPSSHGAGAGAGAGETAGALPGPWVCSETASRSARPRGWREDAAFRGDALAMALKAALDRLALVTARAAEPFCRQHGWFELGFARAEDFARERLGRSSRWLRDLAALADACRQLPGLAAALTGDDGGHPIGVVAALLIGRVASVESLPVWVACARRSSVRALRATVRQARAADTDRPDGGDLAAGATGEDDGEDPGVDGESRQAVYIEAPPPVWVAFDETLDLYRAVEGHESTVTSFVDALVAEATTGLRPIDIVSLAPVTGPSRDAVESTLARTTGNWSHLPEASGDSWAFVMALRSLEAFRRLESMAGQGGPVELGTQLRALVDLEDGLQRRLGMVLAEMGDRGAWSRLRFAGLGHYAEQRLGMSRTTARDRAMAARALRGLATVRRAHDDGEIGLEATLRLVRLLRRTEATAEAQRVWVERAREATVKRLRDEVRALEREGADPRPLDDADWQASIRREPGMARERIRRLGESLASDPGPAVFHRLTLPDDIAGRFVAAVEAERRRIQAAIEDEGEACRRIPAWVGLFSLLTQFVDTWDPPTKGRRRADRVFERDGFRCTAPGCTMRRNLQLHHLAHRSWGGGNERSNLATACVTHHLRGEHGGLASCRGRAPLGVVWRLGRKKSGVWYRNERRLSPRPSLGCGRSRPSTSHASPRRGIPSPTKVGPDRCSRETPP